MPRPETEPIAVVISTSIVSRALVSIIRSPSSVKVCGSSTATMTGASTAAVTAVTSGNRFHACRLLDWTGRLPWACLAPISRRFTAAGTPSSLVARIASSSASSSTAAPLTTCRLVITGSRRSQITTRSQRHLRRQRHDQPHAAPRQPRMPARGRKDQRRQRQRNQRNHQRPHPVRKVNRHPLIDHRRDQPAKRQRENPGSTAPRANAASPPRSSTGNTPPPPASTPAPSPPACPAAKPASRKPFVPARRERRRHHHRQAKERLRRAGVDHRQHRRDLRNPQPAQRPLHAHQQKCPKPSHCSHGFPYRQRSFSVVSSITTNAAANDQIFTCMMINPRVSACSGPLSAARCGSDIATAPSPPRSYRQRRRHRPAIPPNPRHQHRRQQSHAGRQQPVRVLEENPPTQRVIGKVNILYP